ncbi:ATP-binding protein [Amycolatopsis magusensis]|uniref:ATP-binding protein n=1 Tax=Amycolatopsis magusensis TaxID=882444 RepID=UPI0024A847FF|nr:helix-turn-helix domain-containing protein [Amycolatopsis magusensis]MDI5976855.1 tetratricopeptide repeat protein [Amycolatopsis magusensis]
MGEPATFGAELRRRRIAAGMSLTRLAELTHYSKGYLSKLETGTMVPNPSVAALCEAALELHGELTALLPIEPRRRRSNSVKAAGGLPAVSTHFTGRAAELPAVRRALTTEGGVCVISGMGGVGKTALAVWSANRLAGGFGDGCLFLDLRGQATGSGVVSSADALDRLLRMLDVPAERIPADEDDRAALYRSRLRGRSVLIVLDNAATTAQVRPLLPAEPKCRVLITSRRKLIAMDDAEHVFLDVLPIQDAVDLFTSMTGAEDDETVRRIATSCGCLPLAVRIVAARLRGHPDWPVAELLRRLEEHGARLEELDDGERSVTAAFELSYRNLPDDQSRLFRLLSLHPGASCDADAAAALADLPLRVAERLLVSLSDAHLLTQPVMGRYGYHDLVREFAASVRASTAEDESAAFRRLLDHTTRTALRADELITPQRYRPTFTFDRAAPAERTLPDEAAAAEWFRVEWPNLVLLCREAYSREQPDRCWQLAFLSRSYFFLSKRWDPWIRTHRWALAATEKLADPWVRAMTSTNLGVALIDRGDLGAAAEQYELALQLFRELGDRHGESTVLADYAWIHHYRGEHEIALGHLRTALDFYRQDGNLRNAAITERGVALVLTALGRHTEAITLAEGALAAFETLDLPLDEAMALNCLGCARLHAGQHDRARDAYTLAADRAERCSSAFESARALTGLGNLAAAAGDAAEAERLWARADKIHPGLNADVVSEAKTRAHS